MSSHPKFAEQQIWTVRLTIFDFRSKKPKTAFCGFSHLRLQKAGKFQFMFIEQTLLFSLLITPGDARGYKHVAPAELFKRSKAKDNEACMVWRNSGMMQIEYRTPINPVYRPGRDL